MLPNRPPSPGYSPKPVTRENAQNATKELATIDNVKEERSLQMPVNHRPTMLIRHRFRNSIRSRSLRRFRFLRIGRFLPHIDSPFRCLMLPGATHAEWMLMDAHCSRVD